MIGEAVWVVEFDFEARQERRISVDDVCASCSAGHSCWIDVDLDAVQEPKAILNALGLDGITVEAVFTAPASGRFDLYPDCIHIGIGVPGEQEGRLSVTHVDLVLGERFIVTLRHGRIAFIEETRKGYAGFFHKFAETLGFLLFELWDNAINAYLKALMRLEDEVEAVQAQILGAIDDSIFNRVGEVTHDLLLLRKHVLADREVLEQLALRKSAFVSPTTQPYLANMVGTLQRLGDDLTTEREILAELLALYLGIVSHRTNRLVNRLTVISVIFLPLTFLCGVYGMNFDNMPELHWSYGMVYFWAMAIVISAGLVAFMKWRRWL
jgi:magnesium transporter